jgi:hypothetical protein
MQASGFRRLGLAVCAAWLVVTGVVLTYELVTRHVGYFVEMTLPVGTVVNGHQATLPDGRVVNLDATIAPRSSAPGRIQWEGDPAVAELHVQPLLLGVAVGIPLLAWLAIDGIALLTAWVSRGFRRRASQGAQ